MHTTPWTDPDSGVEYRVHANQGFDGGIAHVVVPRGAVPDPEVHLGSAGETWTIFLPAQLLRDLTYNLAIDDLINTLEEEYR